MQEHVRCGLSNKSHLRPVYFQISDTAKLDQSNDSSEPCILPSHQLIADAIQGLHLLSRSRTTVELVDLFTSFLLINSPVYSSQNASTHAVRGKGRYIDNYIDGSRQISQNRFTKDQVLQMMSGLQCMHTEVPDLDDTGAMSRAVDRMFSYLIEQLYLSQDLDMRDYSENSIKHEQSSTNMPMPKDLHLSPHQLGESIKYH